MSRRRVLLGGASRVFFFVLCDAACAASPFLRPLSADETATLTFKSPLLEKPLSIPAKKVSTVFFADESKAAVDAPTTPLLMKLRDGGTLKLQSCVFSGDNVQVRHSLLGALQLKRASIISIEQVTKPTSSEPAPSE